MRLPRMLEPLRIRDFALLWAGMSVSLVGDAIFLVALAWQVYELSNDPSRSAGSSPRTSRRWSSSCSPAAC